MNMGNKAPEGGLTSRVNGEFYKGGRFMPITGEYCGKGKNRVEKSKIDEINLTLSNARIGYDEKNNLFFVERFVTFADGYQTWQRAFSAASLKTVAKFVA